jgi:ribosomal protein S18 acetylase RimI-like enzyme
VSTAEGYPSPVMDDEALGRAFAEVSKRRRLASAGDVVEVDGLVLLFHPSADDEVNYAVVAREPSDPVAAIGRAREVFAERDRRFGLDLQAGRHPAVDAAVRATDLVLLFDRPLMTAPLASIPAVILPEGVEVVRAASIADLDEAAAVDAEVFGSSLATSRGHYAEGMLEAPRAATLMARQDGRVVGAAIGFAVEGAVGIFGVGVLPHARGRGLGAALTSAAVHAVGSPGDEVWLQPSDLARPLYERLGFRDRASFEVWTESRPS